MLSEIPKVALLVDTSYGVRRDMLLGMTRFVRQHGPWSLYIAGGEHKDALPKMKEWGGHGVIARIPDARTEQSIIEAGVPTITLCLAAERKGVRKSLPFVSNVTFDAAEEVARLAVQHFVERRFRNYGFVGVDAPWSQGRETAFCNRLREFGLDVIVYRQPQRVGVRAWEHEQSVLTQWIANLPKPIAILACNDDRGRQVLEACRFAGVDVPEEVAVLGVDNDEVFCEVADPPLSSIVLDADSAGYAAAEVLDGMIRGRVTRPGDVCVKATGIVTRRSTDVFALNDPDVSAALKFIRRQHGCGISVSDVAAEVATSRRTLEKQFRKIVGRTILDEIQRARLEHAKELLLETSHPVSRIAMLAGFRTPDYFVRFFERRVGVTPVDFRNASAI
jgi:LacI family transcriptional regulator